MSPETLLKEVEDDMAIIFVMNENYLDEIKDMSYNKYTYVAL